MTVSQRVKSLANFLAMPRIINSLTYGTYSDRNEAVVCVKCAERV